MTSLDVNSHVTVAAEVMHLGAAAAMLQISEFKLFHIAYRSWCGREASENEFREKFPECDVGAMPPFGNLCGMDVYVPESLAEDENIAFSAGSHVEVVKISYEDFENLVKPKVVKFSQKNLPATAVCGA